MIFSRNSWRTKIQVIRIASLRIGKVLVEEDAHK